MKSTRNGVTKDIEFYKGLEWGKPLVPEMIQFQKETNSNPIWNEKITGKFEYWMYWRKQSNVNVTKETQKPKKQNKVEIKKLKKIDIIPKQYQIAKEEQKLRELDKDELLKIIGTYGHSIYYTENTKKSIINNILHHKFGQEALDEYNKKKSDKSAFYGGESYFTEFEKSDEDNDYYKKFIQQESDKEQKVKSENKNKQNIIEISETSKELKIINFVGKGKLITLEKELDKLPNKIKNKLKIKIISNLEDPKHSGTRWFAYYDTRKKEIIILDEIINYFRLVRLKYTLFHEIGHFIYYEYFWKHNWTSHQIVNNSYILYKPKLIKIKCSYMYITNPDETESEYFADIFAKYVLGKEYMKKQFYATPELQNSIMELIKN